MIEMDRRHLDQSYRVLPQERAVAFSIGGTSHAVMMATPKDYEDFAIGFLYTDGVIARAADVEDLVVVEQEIGVDIQVRLRSELAENYRAKRRVMMGPLGCGICGVESLEIAVPELEAVKGVELSEDFPQIAFEHLESAQAERKSIGALHGAALLDADGVLEIAREDIGRHNAMDKVIGAALRNSIEMENKALVLSSRVSLDLVVKAVRARVGCLVARGTPSDLATHFAAKWNLTLAAPIF